MIIIWSYLLKFETSLKQASALSFLKVVIFSLKIMINANCVNVHKTPLSEYIFKRKCALLAFREGNFKLKIRKNVR